jgi:hypothetical protein
MVDTYVHIAGELNPWPTKAHMVSILRDAGLNIHEGRYSIRIDDCSHFAFNEYGGDLGDPQIEGDADSLEQMMRDSKLVSDILAHAGIKHRFEIYDDHNARVGYLHHEWPLDELQ